MRKYLLFLIFFGFFTDSLTSITTCSIIMSLYIGGNILLNMVLCEINTFSSIRKLQVIVNSILYIIIPCLFSKINNNSSKEIIISFMIILFYLLLMCIHYIICILNAHCAYCFSGFFLMWSEIFLGINICYQEHIDNKLIFFWYLGNLMINGAILFYIFCRCKALYRSLISMWNINTALQAPLLMHQ